VPGAPTSGLKVLGIAQCALGLFGLASAPLAIVTRLLVRDPASRRMQELMWEGALGAWMYTSLALGTLVAMVLIAAGAQVLRGRRSGRTLTLVHAVASIALLIIGQLVSLLLLYPMLWQMGSSGNPAERGGAIGGMVGGLFGSLFGLALPVVELVVMTRPGVREFFQRSEAG